MISAGYILIGLAGVSLTAALGLVAVNTRLNKEASLLTDAINDMSVDQLNYRQQHVLTLARNADMLNDGFLKMVIDKGLADQPTDMFKFKISIDERQLIWYQTMDGDKFFPALLQLNGSRNLLFAIKYKHRLKTIAAEAYTMWKISQP